MAKFSERGRNVLRVIQPATRSTLGEYDSHPPLARYVWYLTCYLRSSCCSETTYAYVQLPVFLPLSTLDVTHVRKCTRPSPLYHTASDEKLGDGLGTRLGQHCAMCACTRCCSDTICVCMYVCMYIVQDVVDIVAIL